MSDTDVKTSPPQYKLEEGDHERFAHYVIGGQEAILTSMVTGDPVTALCGKVWVPSRDPPIINVCGRSADEFLEVGQSDRIELIEDVSHSCDDCLSVLMCLEDPGGSE